MGAFFLLPHLAALPWLVLAAPAVPSELTVSQPATSDDPEPPTTGRMCACIYFEGKCILAEAYQTCFALPDGVRGEVKSSNQLKGFVCNYFYGESCNGDKFTINTIAGYQWIPDLRYEYTGYIKWI
ncbi:hypothetical protein K458DRAFT_385313 [Lentithecium fluviatile CBS 122367]|uniref:Uncharacterized protein n=1 Tax=Lentithecium fluviatile CBS 122367 TaxID=1168545 RepID=A0A6G1JC44_9PLEO|nr:hypothetical protein K458DRAFT_385313 [Lentithecium fluviatile CBS 122367]